MTEPPEFTVEARGPPGRVIVRWSGEAGTRFQFLADVEGDTLKAVKPAMGRRAPTVIENNDTPGQRHGATFHSALVEPFAGIVAAAAAAIARDQLATKAAAARTAERAQRAQEQAEHKARAVLDALGEFDVRARQIAADLDAADLAAIYDRIQNSPW